MKEIIAEFEETEIAVRFPYDEELIIRIKSIKEANWSSMEKIWRLPNDKATVDPLFQTYKGIAWIKLIRSANKSSVTKTEKLTLALQQVLNCR